MTEIIKIGQTESPGEAYYLPAEKLISGNPEQNAWTQYTDPGEKYFAGIWCSDIGKWKISYTEEEYCEILEGKSVITDSAGNAVTVTAGYRFVIPAGFEGTWEVVDRCKKIFVIYESGV